MSTVEEKQKRYAKEKRRSRIRSMKNAIIGFLLLWMTIVTVALFVLVIKVFSLSRAVSDLSATKGSVTLYQSENKEKSSLLQSLDLEEVRINDTAESNLAGLDDTLKVYLTFDDGPSTNTEAILKILDDYGIKATFFVQGKTDEESAKRMKMIVDEGHTIAIHTYSHSYSKIYESLESFVTDVESIRELVYKNTGVDTKYYRFPGGSSNQVSGGNMGDFIEYLNDNGYTYIDWNVASNDAANPPLSKEAIVENVMNDVIKYKTSIVLLHDSDKLDTTVEALPALIERLRESEAVILPISKDTNYIQHVTLDP